MSDKFIYRQHLEMPAMPDTHGGNACGEQPSKKVLIVEDDRAIAKGLEVNLNKEGYTVYKAGTGEHCLAEAQRHLPDAIILDVMLPGGSGLDVCRELRKRGIEAIILMLTVRGKELDKVVGLEVGADDYMVKPFSLAELLARLRAHLRRGLPPSRDLHSYSFDNIVVDFDRFTAHRAGKPVSLTTKEIELLQFLIGSRGEVLSRDRILEVVWGYEHMPSTRTVDNHILRLRHKLEAEPGHPKYILSIYGEGYKFVG